jgi:DMSO/TMAO reductase YedYZ molybdopterin-dependent catalytic subunit
VEKTGRAEKQDHDLKSSRITRREFLKNTVFILGGAVLGPLALMEACRGANETAATAAVTTPSPAAPDSPAAAADTIPAEASATASPALPQELTVVPGETAPAADPADLTAAQSETATGLAPISPVITPAKISEVEAANALSIYRLNVDGQVGRPLNLGYQSLTAYPPLTVKAIRDCSGNLDLERAWTGVPLVTVLQAAQPNADASQVTVTSTEGYYQQFSLRDLEVRGMVLAYQVDGQPLPPERGSPLRLVVPDAGGEFWVKNVWKITLT